MTIGRGVSSVVSTMAVWLSFSGVTAVGCSNAEIASKDDPEAGATRQALGPSEDEAVQKTLAPLRALAVPSNVYLKSVEQTITATGTFSQIFHVYQPDATGEAIRFQLTAKTSSGSTDFSHGFRSVSVTSHPGEADEATQTFVNAFGQATYEVPTSRSGWYRVRFDYNAPNSGRTLAFGATDTAGNALKLVWADPAGANVHVKAQLVVLQNSPVFFKGGAYRNTNSSEFAYADNIKVDANLLYRRSFDQGRFAFPLGQLAAGNHTLEFTLSASGSNAGKFWFTANEWSFDPLAAKGSWDNLQFLYYGAMHTGDYDAWSDGVAFAQGATLNPGVRPPPVRRGTSFAVALENAGLNGPNQNAILRIYPLGSSTETQWPVTNSYDYQGGIYTNTGFSARSRELRTVSIPSNAPVGRYVVRAFAPNGSRIGTDVLFYVIHNPYPLVGSGGLTKAELETNAYDEDEDGVNLQGAFGSDQDNQRDHFTVIYESFAENSYTPWVKLTGAFRRTRDETYYSMLDSAMAAVHGTTTEFESMRRLYRIVAQRLKYNRQDIQDDSSTTFLGFEGNGMTPELAALTRSPGTEFPSDKLHSAQCFDYGTILAALARSSGIVSRVVHSHNDLGGWGNHVFTEAYIPSLPQHGGKVQNNSASANSDSDRWYVFDSTDPNGTGNNPRQFSVYSEAIGPRSQYGRATKVLSGVPVNPINAVTNTVSWDPFSHAEVTAAGVNTVSAAYDAGPEFWITSSGITGWLGYGEKDVYRINKTTTRAKAIRVRSLPNGGEYLIPKLCVASASNLPAIPERCADAASHYNLPAGDAYVIVFNDALDQPDHRTLRGDSIQYILELEY